MCVYIYSYKSVLVLNITGYSQVEFNLFKDLKLPVRLGNLVKESKKVAQVVESACNVGDPGLILVSGRSPGEVNGTPLQHSCLENPMDRGDWQATSMGSQEQLTLH